MFNKTRVYDLSFVSPRRKQQTNPQIVFTVHKDHLGGYIQRLDAVKSTFRKEIATYFGSDREFTLPELSSKKEFGFEKCGTLTESDDQINLCINLSEKALLDVVMTINVLTVVLIVPPDGPTYLSNQSQLLELETICRRNRSEGYGHAIGGQVSPRFISWIRTLCKDASEHDYVPVPESVVEAMREAWIAVVQKEYKKWARDCSGYFYPEGRFVLNCMGNACDVAIYPDGFRGDEKYGSNFSCHNLDHARQQITLIAGLARMCELVRQNE